MDDYYERICWLFYILAFFFFLTPLTFSKAKGSDVTRRAVLSLFRAGSNWHLHCPCRIEQPSAIQTMAKLLRRYGKQLYHTWNFNFSSRQRHTRRKSDVNFCFPLSCCFEVLLCTTPKQNTWVPDHAEAVNISEVQLNNIHDIVCSMREVLVIKSEKEQTRWRREGASQLPFDRVHERVFIERGKTRVKF